MDRADTGGGFRFGRPDLIRCHRHLCEPGSVDVNSFGESGERIKSVAGRSSAVIKPAGPVDPQFFVVSIQHLDGRPLANGYGGYLPPPEQHELGGYETWPARSSLLEVRAEPQIRAEALRLLGEVALRR